MGYDKLSEDIIEKLNIENLEQIFEEDLESGNFRYVGLGELTLNYDATDVLKNGHISISTPEDSTHYYLGGAINRGNSSSNNQGYHPPSKLLKIVFLKKK